MKLSHSLMLSACAAAFALPAAAREDLVMVSVDKVLRHPTTQASLNGVSVSFGSPGASYAQGTELNATSYARHTAYNRLYDSGIVRRLTDEETCQLALRYTLSYMTSQAKRRGATSVTDIVSTFNGKEGGSPAEVQCLVTNASATTVLKGRAQ